MRDKIQLETPYEKVKQEEIKETITELNIFQYEDNGTQIKVRTNIGLFILYENEEYPKGGIFDLRKDDIITKLKLHLDSLNTK